MKNKALNYLYLLLNKGILTTSKKGTHEACLKAVNKNVVADKETKNQENGVLANGLPARASTVASTVASTG